jgi:hypothetical protein
MKRVMIGMLSSFSSQLPLCLFHYDHVSSRVNGVVVRVALHVEDVGLAMLHLDRGFEHPKEYKLRELPRSPFDEGSPGDRL